MLLIVAWDINPNFAHREAFNSYDDLQRSFEVIENGAVVFDTVFTLTPKYLADIAKQFSTS